MRFAFGVNAELQDSREEVAEVGREAASEGASEVLETVEEVVRVPNAPPLDPSALPNGATLFLHRGDNIRHVVTYSLASDSWSMVPALPARYPRGYRLCVEAHRFAWDGTRFVREP